MQMEFKNDEDNDSMEWPDFSQISPLEDDGSAKSPSAASRNPRLFDLSGESESVSTMGNPRVLVKFKPNDEEDCDNGDAKSHLSHTTDKSTKTTSSTVTQMNTLESMQARQGSLDRPTLHCPIDTQSIPTHSDSCREKLHPETSVNPPTI